MSRPRREGDADADGEWRVEVGLQSDLEFNSSTAQCTHNTAVPRATRHSTTSRRVRLRRARPSMGDETRQQSSARARARGRPATARHAPLHSPPLHPHRPVLFPVFPDPAPATVHEGNSGDSLAGRPAVGRQPGRPRVSDQAWENQKWQRLRPCLVLRKFCKIFHISRHIESLDVCIKY